MKLTTQLLLKLPVSRL